MKFNFRRSFVISAILLVVIVISACKNEKKAIEDSNLDDISQNWSDDDIQIVEGIKKRINYGYDRISFGKEPGTFTFYYYEADGREKKVLAPAAFVPEREENLYKKYPFLIKGDHVYSAEFYSTDDFSVMAFKEKDKDDILTVFFTTDRWKTWAATYIKIEDDYIAEVNIKPDYVYLSESDRPFPRFYICCLNSTTGYLKIYPRHKPGGSLYRTENSGISWEFICELPEHDRDMFFAQEGEIFLCGRKGNSFCLYKSDDFVNWVEQDFPIDTEKYKGGDIVNVRLEGNYGVVRTAMLCKEVGENGSLSKRVYYATKDGGKKWLFWKEEV